MPLLVALLLDGITVVLAAGCLMGNPRFRFVKKPLFAIPYLLVVGLIVVYCIRLWAGDGRISFGIGMLACIALAPPLSLVLVAVAGEGLTSLLTGGRFRSGPRPVSCDLAEAAWRSGDMEKADKLFQEALGQQEEEGQPLDFTLAHLTYGNFLTDQQRFAEGASQWQKALAAGLADSQYIMTAVRLSELYRNRLDKKENAVAVLEAALAKYPDAPEAEAVRGRLENWR